jgi:hypothetical protein
MKWIAMRKPEQNLAAVDPWTLVHFSTGLALGLIRTPFREAMLLSVAYELAEQVFERSKCGKAFFEVHGPESIPNAIVDLVVLSLGHHLGQMWNSRT